MYRIVSFNTQDNMSYFPAKGEMGGRPVSPAGTISSKVKLRGRFVLHELPEIPPPRRVQAEFPLSGGKGAGELTTIRHSSSSAPIFSRTRTPAAWIARLRCDGLSIGMGGSAEKPEENFGIQPVQGDLVQLLTCLQLQKLILLY